MNSLRKFTQADNPGLSPNRWNGSPTACDFFAFRVGNAQSLTKEDVACNCSIIEVMEKVRGIPDDDRNSVCIQSTSEFHRGLKPK